MLHATNLRIPIVEVEGGTLTALAGFDGHQGVALVVAPRRYADPETILARAIERGEPPFVLVLDSLEDPQNVGTLLRSAEAAATHGVIFPTHRQAPLTPAAIKASAGAVEHLLLAPVDDLAAALADLHVRGLRIVGAEADAPLTVREADLRGPLALVVGSEGQGLGPAVRRRCDLLVRIPMRGAVGSLNASVAGSILLYEAATQRGGAEAERAGRAAPGTSESPAVPADDAPAGDALVENAPTAAAGPGATDDAPPTDGGSPGGPADPEPEIEPVAPRRRRTSGAKAVVDRPAPKRAAAPKGAAAPKPPASPSRAKPRRRPVPEDAVEPGAGATDEAPGSLAVDELLPD